MSVLIKKLDFKIDHLSIQYFEVNKKNYKQLKTLRIYNINFYQKSTYEALRSKPMRKCIFIFSIRIPQVRFR